MGAGYHGGFGKTNGEQKHQEKEETKTQTSLIDQKIVAEMERDNVKFNKENLLFVTKDKTGQTIFLEQGNDSAGLKHIQKRHTQDFEKKHNIQPMQIMEHVYSVFTEGDLEYSRTIEKNGREGFERLYKYKEKYYLLSGIGTNGFVVSAYPLDEEDAKKHIRRYKK